MAEKKNLKFLKDLLLCAGPSGFEEESAAVFRSYLNTFCDRVETDVMGNTYGILNEKAPFRVMLAGHYDEVGFQIVYIDEEGLLYFRPNGGIDKLNVPSSEVVILSKRGKVPGVIGKKPIHLLSAKEREQPVEIENMWIDIGASNRAEAEKLVAVGDPVAMKSNFLMLNENRIMSKGLDDRIGAYVVAETLRKLSARKKELKVAVFGVGTVQEELGTRGAKTSAFAIDPQAAFAIDVGFASDLPDIPKKKLGDIRLGAGPEVARSADTNPVLGALVRRVAAKHKIPYQETPAHRASGGTDAAAIQLSGGGVATSLISIPNRYMHSPVEICDLRDADNAAELLAQTILALSGKETFRPGLD